MEKLTSVTQLFMPSLPQRDFQIHARKLSSDRLRRQRLEEEAFCAGIPGIEGIVPVAGQKDHIGTRIDAEQLAAELKTAEAAHLDIQEGQEDRIGFCKGKGIRGLEKARDHSPGKNAFQYGDAAAEEDLFIIHQNDVGGFLALLRRVQEGVDVHVKRLCDAGDHLDIRQADTRLPLRNRRTVDEDLLRKLLLRVPFLLTQTAERLGKNQSHRSLLLRGRLTGTSYPIRQKNSSTE